MRPRSSSRGRNTSASVTVTVTVSRCSQNTDLDVEELSRRDYVRDVVERRSRVVELGRYFRQHVAV